MQFRSTLELAVYGSRTGYVKSLREKISLKPLDDTNKQLHVRPAVAVPMSLPVRSNNYSPVGTMLRYEVSGPSSADEKSDFM